NGTMFGKGAYQVVAYNCISMVIAIAHQEFGSTLECIVPVEIVGIDNSERFVHYFHRTKNGMGCTPGFLAILGILVSFRKRIHILVRVGRFHLSGELGLEYGFKVIGKLAPDDKYYFSKS